MPKKKQPAKPVKRTFYNALSDLNALLSLIADGRDTNTKIEKPEWFAAVQADPEETYYEVFGKLIADVEEHYEADIDKWKEDLESSKEELKAKDKEIDEIDSKKKPTVSVAFCEDGDYTGQSLGIHADNLRDQEILDNVMIMLHRKSQVNEDILDYKMMR